MNVFLAVLAIPFFVLLVLVAAMRPAHSTYTKAELRRRSKNSKQYQLELEREELLPSIETALRITRSLLLVTLIVLLISGYGWLLGVVLALILAIIYPVISRYRATARAGSLLYGKLEPYILKMVTRIDKFLRALGDDRFISGSHLRADSHEELTEIIDNSADILSKDERTLIVSALGFSKKVVESVMTPKSMIDFIDKKEFLGPLVLSELHKLGHSRLPVVAGDIDHVVGILHLRDLLSLDEKKSVTAEKGMEPKVYYIHEKDNLERALGAFLKTRHHLFIVINDQRETVGLLTLEDVLEVLIGRRIVDRDDIHADLRAVAAREGKANNSGANGIDL